MLFCPAVADGLCWCVSLSRIMIMPRTTIRVMIVMEMMTMTTWMLMVTASNLENHETFTIVCGYQQIQTDTLAWFMPSAVIFDDFRSQKVILIR